MKNIILITLIVLLSVDIASALIEPSKSYIIMTPSNINVGDEAIVTLFIKAGVPDGQFNGSVEIIVSEPLTSLNSQSFFFNASDFSGDTPTSKALIYSWVVDANEPGNLNISAIIKNSESLESNLFSSSAIISEQVEPPSESYCGDNICNGNEDCSSCSQDCGSCPPVNPPSGDNGTNGGGGSGGNGGSTGGGSSGGGAGGGGGGGGSSSGEDNANDVNSITETKSNEYFITDKETIDGFTQELNIEDKIKFDIQGKDKTEQHSLVINNIGENFVELTVESEPVKLKLNVGEEKKLNLTSSEYYDLYIKLEKIENSKAKITIKTIHEPIEKKGTGVTGAVIGFSKNSVYLGIGALVLVVIIGIWQGSNYIRRKRSVYF